MKANHHSSHAQQSKTGIVRTFAALVFLTAACFLTPRITLAAEEAQHGASNGHGGGHAESPLTAVWKWGNFLILFGGLGWYLRLPLREFLETRSRSIEEGLASGRLARESALKQMSEIENRMARLDDEVRALRAQAVKEAEEERARILESAKIEAQKILEMAQREIEGLKKSARLELKAHVADLAVKLAEERLQRSVGSEENKRLVVRFLDSLETAKN
ncbi:MAG TPA: F0F1 ATP synthase subunit B [Terriglobia bacterium]|nr:F0F1 ATP synthase subunit B [Terriglobia bacterium]